MSDGCGGVVDCGSCCKPLTCEEACPLVPPETAWTEYVRHRAMGAITRFHVLSPTAVAVQLAAGVSRAERASKPAPFRQLGSRPGERQ